MRFRFAARVIAQLGAELISSDDIAVYELVKNAFDAGSPSVELTIEYLTPVSHIHDLQSVILESFDSKVPLKQIRHNVREGLVTLLPFDAACADRLRGLVGLLVKEVDTAVHCNQFLRLVGKLNTVTIADTGHGMTEDDLEQCFLTVGTTNRLLQHAKAGDEADEPNGYRRVLAGEKGIGRLSAMRLGNDLLVHTWTATENVEHVLDLDWRVFSAGSALDANQIDIDARRLRREHPVGTSGTVLTVNDLQSHWDQEMTTEVASRFLSRFVDPFRPQTARSVHVRWNGHPVEIPGLARRYLQSAHAGMNGTVKVDRATRHFSLTINYWFRARDGGTPNEFRRTYSSADFERLTDAAVAALGPFNFELYYYNRHRLAAIPGFASREDWKKWLDEWAGGLMLYRDGLRVMPYGRLPDDDWLELDKRALRGKGYRVNRIQVVGCVRISRARNPLLQDQTNREGLRDNLAARTFQGFLHRIIEDLFVPLLDQQTREDTKSDEAMLDRSATIQQDVEQAVDQLVRAAERSDATAIASARQELRQALDALPRLTGDLREAVQSHAIRRLEMVELAARGLSAAALAHDLEAALDQAGAETGALSQSAALSGQHREALTHLTSIFRSLRTLVTDIKPGPAKTRRRKSTFDLGQVLEHLIAFYDPKLAQDRIKVNLTLRPKGKPFRIKAVEGHVRQVFDNMFRNSIDWLIDTRLKHPHEAPPAAIDIRLDHRSRSVTFGDTGVGIAVHDADWVFEAFTSHKENGQGLGLYIAKELCEFNAIKIAIDVQTLNQWHRSKQFVLDFSDCYVEGE